jgi:hypothetical protein
MTDADLRRKLKSMPGYVEHFGRAFPREADPVTTACHSGVNVGG